MADERKTWIEWEESVTDSSIRDADGFRDQPFDTLYTEAEFLTLRNRCTITHRPKV